MVDIGDCHVDLWTRLVWLPAYWLQAYQAFLRPLFLLAFLTFLPTLPIYKNAPQMYPRGFRMLCHRLSSGNVTIRVQTKWLHFIRDIEYRNKQLFSFSKYHACTCVFYFVANGTLKIKAFSTLTFQITS